jgi:S-DNA-T family DNA segregation ATPase FtsK/SpoIIIE
MVELGIYNGIPHLLIPVVTDPKKAAGSLQWAVTEMMRRYRSMSDAGVRDLESYNSMIDGGEVEGQRLPQVVVIIDELADLMLVAAKEVEESICRIAQMGRAAGIHLIIATQRPSADVITGLMKANIPSRIAFAVASAMESRIILDTQGAEKLVGKGDMLYSPIGSGKPQRVQGCFVTDAEVESVANYVKEHFASTYDQSVMDDIERKAEQTGTKGAPATASDPDPSDEELTHDEMLPDAVEVILETKQASVSLLQRRLKLGYARAARIVDEMEELGIVGPFAGAKPRQILITKEQWDQMKQGQTIVKEPEPVPEEDIDIPF